MSDNITDFGIDLFQDDDDDGIGLHTWVGIIAGVLSGLSILTIASVYFSQRCCTPKREEPEAVLLKRRMQIEQKKMASYKCKLPAVEHPQCTSIMQQEENDIAEEVKEAYPKVSTDNSKPIVCCPDKKTLYCYNPKVNTSGASNEYDPKAKYTQRKIMIDKVIQSINKNLVEQDNLDTLSVHEIASEALKKIAKCQLEKRSPRHSDFSYCSESSTSPEGRKLLEGLESIRKIYEDIEEEKENVDEDCPKDQYVKSTSRNLFTESEINNADNIKSLFFEKWMKQAGESDENSDESVHKDVSISYDDVDSVLTSISRMDTKRMKRLKNTRFYKRMISGIHAIKSESVPTDHNSDEEQINSYEKKDFAKRHSIDPITENELYMTQEEINYMALNEEVQEEFEKNHEPKDLPPKEFKTKDQRVKASAIMADDGDKLNTNGDERSETTFFKIIRPAMYPEKTTLSRKCIREVDECSSSSSDDDGISVVPSTMGENFLHEDQYDAEKGSEYDIDIRKSEYDIGNSSGKEQSQMTRWSQSIRDQPSSGREYYYSDYTRTNKDDSCYSSGIHKGCCSFSSCSCVNKTTTWGEIAFKEREKYKSAESKHQIDEIANDLQEKEGSQSDLYYIISNNNCFVVPVTDERNICTESEMTPTFFMTDDKHCPDFPSTRHTT